MPAEAGGNRPDKQDKRSKNGADEKVPTSPSKPVVQSTQSKPVKLSYKLKLELEELPGTIEALEQDIARLQTTIADSDFYAGPPNDVSATLEELTDKESRLEQVIERWMELEEQANQ